MISGKADIKTGVSVVICCFNSAARLPETLRHLALQRVPPGLLWEIILVDNASVDDTADMARREWQNYGRTDVDFTVLYEQRPGKNHALDLGIANAAYNYILICDDDNWLNEDYVFNAFSLMEAQPQTGAAGGQSTAVSDIPLPDWFTEHQYAYAVGKQQAASGDITTKKYLWGAGMIFKKALYQQLYASTPSFLSGPKADLVSRGEDVEFCIRVILSGHRLYYEDALIFRHYMPAGRLQPAYLKKLLEGYERESYILTVYAKQLDINRLSAWGRTSLLLASTARYAFSKIIPNLRWSADYEAEIIFLLCGARLAPIPEERVRIHELALHLSHAEDI